MIKRFNFVENTRFSWKIAIKYGEITHRRIFRRFIAKSLIRTTSVVATTMRANYRALVGIAGRSSVCTCIWVDRETVHTNKIGWVVDGSISCIAARSLWSDEKIAWSRSRYESIIKPAESCTIIVNGVNIDLAFVAWTGHWRWVRFPFLKEKIFSFEGSTTVNYVLQSVNRKIYRKTEPSREIVLTKFFLSLHKIISKIYRIFSSHTYVRIKPSTIIFCDIYVARDIVRKLYDITIL